MRIDIDDPNKQRISDKMTEQVGMLVDGDVALEADDDGSGEDANVSRFAAEMRLKEAIRPLSAARQSVREELVDPDEKAALETTELELQAVRDRLKHNNDTDQTVH